MNIGAQRKSTVATLLAVVTLGGAMAAWAGTPCPSPKSAELVPGGTCQNVEFDFAEVPCGNGESGPCYAYVVTGASCTVDRPVRGGCIGGIYANNAFECNTYQQPLYGHTYSSALCRINGQSCSVTGDTYPSEQGGYNTNTPCEY